MARTRRWHSAGTIALLLSAILCGSAAVTARAEADDGASEQDSASLKAALKEAQGQVAHWRSAFEGEQSKAQRAEAAAVAQSDSEARAAEAEKAAAEAQEGQAVAQAAEEAAKKAQRAAEAEQSQLQERLRKAEAFGGQLSEVKAQLAAAQSALAKTEAELKAADARASDTQQLADSLLAQHYNEWVPHWVADGYERRVRPAAASAWEAADTHSRTLYRSGSDVAGRAWTTASPHVQYATDYTVSLAKNTHDKVVKHPHIAALKRRFLAATAPVRKALGSLLQAPPVRILLAQARRTQAELEAVFSRFLRRFPLLAPLGAAGTVTFVVWAVLAAPLLALLAPLLLLPRKNSTARPTSSSSARNGGSAAKAKKGRRITMGGDTVSYA